MPDLIRLYIRSVCQGFGIAALFTVMLIWWDVAGIGHLILGSDVGWIAAAMMVFFNGIVFSAVQFAFRIMAMAGDDAGPTGGHGAREPVLIPVLVPVRRRKG
jgi:TRAP-type C4-dicarboxylate transport system permease small subunit